MKKNQESIKRCPAVSALQRIIGGKWKIEILYYISFENVCRFGGLRKRIVGITESGLTKQLRELEADGFITRHDFGEVPPHVEYALTELGTSFIPILEHMKRWGEENLDAMINR